MKKLLFLIAFLFISISLWAQSSTTPRYTGDTQSSNTTREYLANGGYTERQQNADGSITTTISTPCLVCNKKGKCLYCGGLGHIYYAYGGNVTCSFCWGRGKCLQCNGTGFKTTKTTYNPNSSGNYNGGYPAGGGYSGGGYSGGGYSSGSSSGSSSTRRTCPSCNGSGKGMDQIHYSPNYTGGDNSRYCSQCGGTRPAHTHIRQSCQVCYGKGYVGN